MELREAAQQAIAALCEIKESAQYNSVYAKAIDALRAAIAEESMQRLTDVQQEMEAISNETRHHRAYRMLKEAMDSDRENIIKNMPDFDFHAEVQKRYETKISAFDTATIKDNLSVEPVAWVRVDRGHIDFHKHPDYLPLYTTLPQRKPLTDDEIENCIDESFEYGLDRGNISNKSVIRFARALERAHGIGGEDKNG